MRACATKVVLFIYAITLLLPSSATNYAKPPHRDPNATEAEVILRISEVLALALGSGLMGWGVRGLWINAHTASSDKITAQEISEFLKTMRPETLALGNNLEELQKKHQELLRILTDFERKVGVRTKRFRRPSELENWLDEESANWAKTQENQEALKIFKKELRAAKEDLSIALGEFKSRNNKILKTISDKYKMTGVPPTLEAAEFSKFNSFEPILYNAADYKVRIHPLDVHRDTVKWFNSCSALLTQVPPSRWHRYGIPALRVAGGGTVLLAGVGSQFLNDGIKERRAVAKEEAKNQIQKQKDDEQEKSNLQKDEDFKKTTKTLADLKQQIKDSEAHAKAEKAIQDRIEGPDGRKLTEPFYTIVRDALKKHQKDILKELLEALKKSDDPASIEEKADRLKKFFDLKDTSERRYVNGALINSFITQAKRLKLPLEEILGILDLTNHVNLSKEDRANREKAAWNMVEPLIKMTIKARLDDGVGTFEPKMIEYVDNSLIKAITGEIISKLRTTPVAAPSGNNPVKLFIPTPFGTAGIIGILRTLRTPTKPSRNSPDQVIGLAASTSSAPQGDKNAPGVPVITLDPDGGLPNMQMK